MSVDPTKLRFGPYRSPRFKLGQKIIDESRGEVIIVAISDGPIPWPIGATRGSDRSLVLYADLAKAVRKEASIAVRHWWGIGNWAVWKWRKALGVKDNPGDTALRIEYANRPEHRAMIASVGKTFARDPERRRKIAESRLGKARPREVIEAMRRANVGRNLSAEHRRKMSIAHKKRGTIPPAAGVPWSAEELKLLRTRPTAEVVKRTGRTLHAVNTMRWRLNLPDARVSAKRARTRR